MIPKIPIILEANWLPKKTSGKVLWPFILLRKREDVVTLHHELIHYKQLMDTFVIFGYFWYSVELAIRVVAHRFSLKKAYQNHSMEREAFENQGDFTYCERRERFSFILYL